jgi:hypothetical protein
MGRKDRRKRKSTRNRGKTLSFHGGKLTKRASRLRWKRQLELVLTILFQDVVLRLVRYMAVVRPMMGMGGTAVQHLGLSPVFSTPQRRRRMKFLTRVLTGLTDLLPFRPMALFTW